MKAYHKLKEELEESRTHSLYPTHLTTLSDYFFELEVPFTRVLWNCERNGARIDAQYLANISKPVEIELARIEKDIVRLVGRPINPQSNKDMQAYFFKELKLTPKKLTKGGKSGVRQPSLDIDVIEELSDEHPVAKLLLEHRGLSKLNGTYVKGLNSHMDTNGRIHTRFNQDIVRTGRLSSSNPNIQNVPQPENDKFKIRGAFIPADGKTLIVSDYDTLEMRLLACAAQEASMIQMIKEGKDIHMGNATLVFGERDGFDYDEIAEAKKTDKKVKNGELPSNSVTERMHHLLRRRLQVKTIGFGQPNSQAEVKPHQNGELFAAEAA
jgi:DNA polymerase-1